MRILTLNHEFPPLGGGGGRVSFELGRELAAQGYEVDFLTMGRPGLAAREVLPPGIRVFRVPALRRHVEVCHTHEMATYIATALWKANKLQRRQPYDLCHAHFLLPAGIVARALKRMTGLPYVLSAHGSDLPGYNPDRFTWEHRFTSPLLRSIVNESAGVAAPSGYLRELVLSQKTRAPIDVIPHGVDISEHSPPFKKEDRILVVSRMLRRKGIQYLLEALQGFDLKNFQVDIVGDGPYLSDLKSRSQRLGLSVKFWGWVDRDSLKMKELYQKASIFVMTSQSESFGMVLLDAMCAGAAVVTAEGSGCREVTGEDAALIVPPCDAAAIRAALTRLVEDPGLRGRLADNGRRRVERYYDWKPLRRRYEDLYDRALILSSERRLRGGDALEEPRA